MSEENQMPAPIRSMPETKITPLDVRPILRSGGEPFSVIMEAIGKTPADGALKLRATFKPTPLFHALGSQGWQHWVESGAGDDWTVWFYRATDGERPQKVSQAEVGAAHLEKAHPELAGRLKVEGALWYLDVRRLSPPEPMEMTLTVLEKLPRGTRLVQINERVPQFLLPILKDRGFHYSVDQSQRSEVRVEISR
jgi:uncharacterized protein (DUF2249 family)